jgi:hypothetical protein
MYGDVLHFHQLEMLNGNNVLLIKYQKKLQTFPSRFEASKIILWVSTPSDLIFFLHVERYQNNKQDLPN